MKSSINTENRNAQELSKTSKIANHPCSEVGTWERLPLGSELIKN